MPEALRARREGIDRLLQHVVSGVLGEGGSVSLDRDELWILLDALPVAVLVGADRTCSRVWGNAAARDLYQLPPGQNFSRTAPEDERPALEIYANGEPVDPENLPLQKAARTGEPVAQSECEIRFPDGRRIYIAGHSIPVRNEHGDVCGAIGAFLDLTPRQRELEMSRMVSREMSHRLANTLGIVQSISRRMLRPLLPPETYQAYEARLAALARRQDLLHHGDWKAAGLAQIVNAALSEIFAVARERISLTGPDLEIPASCALPLSMILHELATNALKYGALSASGGAVTVAWRRRDTDGSAQIDLTWVEHDGPPVAPPAAKGFGSDMMAAAAASLPDGHLDLRFERAGASAFVSFSA